MWSKQFQGDTNTIPLQILHYFWRKNNLQIIPFPNHIAKHLLTFISALKGIANWTTQVGMFTVAFDFSYTECTCLLRHDFNIRVSVKGLIQILLRTLLTEFPSRKLIQKYQVSRALTKLLCLDWKRKTVSYS